MVKYMKILTDLCNIIGRKHKPASICFAGISTLRMQTKLKVLHKPVMLDEVLDGLKLKPNSVILDMTFGSGGHSEEFLKRHTDCHILALDRDPRAFTIAEELSVKYCGRVTPLLGKFSEIDTILYDHGYYEGCLDGVLIDAGCSSMQFDESERGFSLSRDGPLDMRMDGNINHNQLTAADVVNFLPVEDLMNIISKYGEENQAERIAKCIVENRPFHRTKELANAIGNSFSAFNHMSRKDALGRRCHHATKTFMALRIFVNNELNELHTGIEMAGKYLKNDARLAVITFHSLEHKVVRRILHKQNDMAHHWKLANKAVRSQYNLHLPFWVINKEDFAKPCLEEVEGNPRSRSAFLRIATRTRSS